MDLNDHALDLNDHVLDLIAPPMIKVIVGQGMGQSGSRIRFRCLAAAESEFQFDLRVWHSRLLALLLLHAPAALRGR